MSAARLLARTLMIQGTASHVGKSVLVTALCRCLARRGFRVTPFKAQNMSLNSAVTAEGGEIGRSQAVQAAACGVEPEVAMNPVLLKPMAGGRCQVIVRGRALCVAEGHGDPEHARRSLAVTAECLTDLRRRFDIVVIEGMGSPAEINLRELDAANMRVAELAEAPVLLAGDISRGGVFAALAGTMELLTPEERRRIRGFLINQFHGDPAVLRPGVEELRRRYGVPTLGVLPYLHDLDLDAEDGVSLDAAPTGVHGLGPRGRPPRSSPLSINVPLFPGIANFTDLGALEREPGVRVRYVASAREWGEPGLVVLPGSRSLAADMAWLRERGLAERVTAHARDGGWVVGLCGGYQMLGQAVLDPEGVESHEGEVSGLGLLDVVTTLAPEKQVARALGECLLPGLERLPVAGYEIHHGMTRRLGDARPALRVVERGGANVDAVDGAVDRRGRVFGTYLHGLFDTEEFRQALLRQLGCVDPFAEPSVDPFDRLADWFEAHVQVEAILALAEAA